MQDEAGGPGGIEDYVFKEELLKYPIAS